MIKSILFSKVIYKILSEDETLGKLVGSRIYPLVAQNTTKFPFIVYSREGISGETCKDGIIEETINFTIVVVHSEYLKGLDIAQTVRDLFEFKRLKFSGIGALTSCLCTSVQEEFSEDSFVQRLSFEAKLNHI